MVRFADYVRDLAGTMRDVYAQCLDVNEVPPHVPRTHTARTRSGYAIDRSLSQLHIDRDWLSARLADYIAWVATGRGRKASWRRLTRAGCRDARSSHGQYPVAQRIHTTVVEWADELAPLRGARPTPFAARA